MKRGAVLFSVVFCAAILSLYFLGIAFSSALFALSAAACVFTGAFRKRKKNYRALSVICALAAALLIAAPRICLTEAIYESKANRTSSVTARLCGLPQEYGASTQYTLRTVSEPFAGNFTFVCYFDADTEIDIGDEITLTAEFVPYSDDALSRLSALSDGVILRARSVKIQDIRKNSAFDLSLAVQSYMAEAFTALFPKNGGLVCSVVTGSKTVLADHSAAILKRAGLYHITAASGMHTGFLCAAVFFLFGGLRRSPHTKKRLLLTAATFSICILFCAAAGFSKSVMRASFMAVISTGSGIFHRRADAVNSLFAALFIILALDPSSVFSISLQLSFFSALSILLFSPKAVSAFRIKSRILRSVYAAAMVSLCAQILTLPIVAIYFGWFSVVSVISNVVLVPFVQIMFLLGAASTALFGVFPALAAVFARIAEVFAAFIEYWASVLSHFPFSYVKITTAMFILLSLAAVSGILTFKMKGSKAAKAIFAAASVLFFLAVPASVYLKTGVLPEHGVSVLFADTGQGDCAAASSGEGFLAVFDCGADLGADACSLLSEQITERELSCVKFIFLTHYHEDHAGGIPSLIASCRPRFVIIPDIDGGNLKDEIVDACEKSGATLIRIGKRLDIKLSGSLRIECMPVFGNSSSAYNANDNENAVVYRLVYGEFSALFSGDIGFLGEAELMSSGWLSQTDLLKAAHHGSKHSSSAEFLAFIDPQAAVVCVGEDNGYGHPAQETLARFASKNINVYRTDTDGALLAHSDGGDLFAIAPVSGTK